MARRVVALCDLDLDYAVKVARIANAMERRGNVEVAAFGGLELMAAFQEAERPALVAVNICWREELRGRLGNTPVVWLTEEQEIEPGDVGELHVFKYQSVPQLMQQIFRHPAIQASAAVEVAAIARRAPVIAVWSVAGGVGKSTVAALLSEEWHHAAEGGIFCLSLESGMTTGLWLKGEGRHDASDWLYRIKSGKRVGEDTVKEASGWGCVELLRQDGSIRELAMLAKPDAEQLVRHAAAMEGCKRVIVDCDAGWSARNEAAWEASDAIICIRGEDRASRARTDKWMSEWPGWQPDGAFRRKMVLAVNKVQPIATDGGREAAYMLPYIPEWKLGNDRSLHCHPAYRQSLLQLMHGLESVLSPI